MSKDRLLSDDGLRAEIANVLLLDRQTMEPYVSVVDDLINLVNTQKRLYAESVIDNVIEDVAGYQAMSNRATVTVNELMNPNAGFRAYAKDLAEQRARISR